jgi:hypothetical protein
MTAMEERRLKLLLKDAVVEVLQERHDLLRQALQESMEEMPMRFLRTSPGRGLPPPTAAGLFLPTFGRDIATLEDGGAGQRPDSIHDGEKSPLRTRKKTFQRFQDGA